MKIATWNIERPNSSSEKRNEKIIAALNKLNADILILTETNSLINPGEGYNVAITDSLINLDSAQYKEGENRVSIYSKYPMQTNFKTYDSNTSICVTIETPIGALQVYGTIIGVNGNTHRSFIPELENQIGDWKELEKKGALCIAGDFNMSFSDSYYFVKEGRNKMNGFFSRQQINVVTASVPHNVDHIAFSETFIKGKTIKTTTWNEVKTLSDHIGVCVTIE